MTPAPEPAKILSARRYYLLKRQAAQALLDEGLALVWQHKQEAESSPTLPTGFPSLSILSDAGYTTVADLNGANEAELRQLGLNASQANAVLTALAPLL